MPTQPVVIDRLWMGTSAQAPWLRRPGTVESGLNARFDLRVGGAVKRGPTTLILDLLPFTGDPFDATKEFGWFSIRSAIVALGITGEVHGWTAAGAPLDIIDSSGGAFATYMTGAALRTDIDLTTDFDTAIVCNRLTVPTLLSGYTYSESYNYIKNGNPSPTLPDAINDQTATGVSVFSQLPSAAVNGDVHRVVSDEQLDPAGIYVRFTGTPHANYVEGYFPDHGNWFRIPKTAQNRARYDETKLPHRIVFNEVAGTLTISKCDWRQRVSGNNQTNAPMPWATKAHPIASVEFLAGRLFLKSRGNITSSRHDDFFNLWNDSVNAIGDSDRIALNTSRPRLGRLLRGRVCGSGLLLLFENGQAEFSSGVEALTNVNGRITPISDYPSRDLKPGHATDHAVMIDMFGDVHTFTWAAQANAPGIMYSGLLSAHQFDVLDGKTVLSIHAVGSTVFLPIDAAAALTHDSFQIDGQTVQSAWSSMLTLDPPVFFDLWSDHIRVVTRKQGAGAGYTLLKYVHREQAPPTGLDFLPNMDRQEFVVPTQMTYDSVLDRTTMFHTGRSGDLTSSRLVTTDPTNKQEFLKPLVVNTNGSVVFDGKRNDATQILGFQFEANIQLTRLYPEVSSRSIASERLVVFHYKTTDYEVAWTPQGGPPRIEPWQAPRVGVAVVGQTVVETHYHEFGMHTDPRRADVILRSTSPGPCAWLALEYTLLAQGRGK